VRQLQTRSLRAKPPDAGLNAFTNGAARVKSFGRLRGVACPFRIWREIGVGGQGGSHGGSALKKLGVKIPAGMTLTTAVTISADGSTMAGQYVNGQTFGNWMAHITK
jgi:hypothetical protein